MPLESYVLVAVLDANNNKSLCLLFTSINIMIQNVKAYSLIGVEHCPFLCPFLGWPHFLQAGVFLGLFSTLFPLAAEF